MQSNVLKKATMLFVLVFLSIPFISLQAQNQQVNIKGNNITLKDAFTQIEQQTKLIIGYDPAAFNCNARIKGMVKNKVLKEVLTEILQGTNCDFEFQNNHIYIYPVKENNHLNLLPSKSSNRSSQQQNHIINGKVVDENGTALAGVTVVVDGTTRGVLTDVDGSFSINVSPDNKLVFSYIGFTTQTIEIGNQKEFIVIMKEKADELQEVTVVAFGKQKKESVISSISTVNTKELKVPSSNLTTALAGRMSGLISYQRSGEPGEDDASFFVRGVTSFSYARGPLILIDGVEMSSSDLARLQPDDIASFSIMKDAAATALYGARGANGVILITTKEGVEGKTQISFRFEQSFSMPTKNIELADPITYMRLNNEAVTTRNPLTSVPYSLEKIDNTILGKNPYVYPANDWYKMLFKNGTPSYRANFNVSGGGKVARYYIAGTFSQDNGNLKVDRNNNFNNNIDLKKYLLRSNININITPTTEAVVRLHGTFDDYSGPIDGGTALYKKVMRADPVLFPAYFHPDETYAHVTHTIFGNYDKGQYINPYADMVKGYKDYSKSLMLAQFEVKQNLSFITDGLSLRGLFNTNRYSYFDVNRFYNPYWYSIGSYDKYNDTYTLQLLNPQTGTQWLSYNEGQKEITSTTYLEGAVNYDNTFSDKYYVSGLLVGTIRSTLTPNASTLTLSLPSRNVGLSGRFTFSYDSRYFTEFNFGYNGSERFATKERFGFFPSIGVAWFVSNENFWSSELSNIISKLKLKATYGLVGNDAIGSPRDRFFYISEVNLNAAGRAFSWGENFDHSVNGVVISRYANEKITWETSSKMNLGLELGLFNKLEIQADYYTEHRKNILMPRADIPSTMGLWSIQQTNVGEAKGNGVDLSIDYQHIISKNLWMTGRANFTYATAKYEVYEEVDNSLTPWLSKIGQPISQQWGYIAERLFVDNLEVKNSPNQTFGEYMGGDLKYRDINGDDQITALDMVPIGFPTMPEIIYGFGLSTGYRDFDLSFFFQGLARESFWIDAYRTAPFIDTDEDANIISKNALLRAYAENHWSENNRDVYALWPRLSARQLDNNTQRSTWFMRDGAFLRLKSVEFGYTLPQKLTNKIGIKNLRIYFAGTNLLTISKFRLWDPEMAGNGLGYPIQKVYNGGLQISF